jgi:formylglycine-generating enzyme
MDGGGLEGSVDSGPEVLAYCCMGDSIVTCGGWPGGPPANDCSTCGGPGRSIQCSDDPDFMCDPNHAVECPADVIYPVRPDAGAQDPNDCPMAEPGCITDGGPDQVCVPEGIFMMGDDSQVDSSPPREVYVSPFWMDRAPVTVARYRECIAMVGCPAAGAHIADGDHEEHPIRSLNVWLMEQFCRWDGGRLPTEAEWERAARGDDGRTYPWGEETGCEYANWADCIGTSAPVDAHPVGASPFGIVDLIGNAAEVTLDGWVDGGYDAYWFPLEACDPLTMETDGIGVRSHVLRGCHYGGAMELCTAFYRTRTTSSAIDYGVGFRCVRDGVPAPEPE